MGTLLRAVVVLSVVSVLSHAKQVSLPVYFVSGDSNASSCQVFDSHNPTRITSSRLEFTNGQRIDFLNARSAVPCTGEEVENRLSVFTGHDPAQWRTHLPMSRRVRFRSVYPGVDVVYYGNGSHLEYDFEVAPRGAISRIGLGFAENAEIRISPAGDLGSEIIVLPTPAVR